jgi:hypothetical protein
MRSTPFLEIYATYTGRKVMNLWGNKSVSFARVKTVCLTLEDGTERLS